MSKSKQKKPLTVYTILRTILIILVCLILLLGIAARILHYYKNHFNYLKKIKNKRNIF